jgi:hypothetical protein
MRHMERRAALYSSCAVVVEAKKTWQNVMQTRHAAPEAMPRDSGLVGTGGRSEGTVRGGAWGGSAEEATRVVVGVGGGEEEVRMA